MQPEHFRPAGQITDRLTAVFPPDVSGWKYRSEEWTDARAADGYRLGSRWRTHFTPSARLHYVATGRPRRKRTPFALQLLNITGPSIALILVLGVTQAERLLYVAAVLP